MMTLVRGPLDLTRIPDSTGTYVLWFDLCRVIELNVGRFGPITVAPGALVYVGSAMGSGGLRARVKRHVRGPGRCHWHIDYLTAACAPSAFYVAPGNRRLECAWIQALQAAGAQAPVMGFGSSDCRQGCQAHLLSLPDGWTFQNLEELL